jgi:hypothetical protein
LLARSLALSFKYALDTELVHGTWMYGGDFPDDSAAMKAAGWRLSPLSSGRVAVLQSLRSLTRHLVLAQDTSYALSRALKIRLTLEQKA